jgi:hypothetical protein
MRFEGDKLVPGNTRQGKRASQSPQASTCASEHDAGNAQHANQSCDTQDETLCEDCVGREERRWSEGGVYFHTEKMEAAAAASPDFHSIPDDRAACADDVPANAREFLETQEFVFGRLVAPVAQVCDGKYSRASEYDVVNAEQDVEQLSNTDDVVEQLLNRGVVMSRMEEIDVGLWD